MPDLYICDEIDWSVIQTLIKFLKPFYELTTIMSGSKYSTISLVYHLIPRLKIHLQKEHTDTRIKKASELFLKKLQDYEVLINNDLSLVSSLLDPRIKLSDMDSNRKDEAIKLVRDARLSRLFTGVKHISICRRRGQ